MLPHNYCAEQPKAYFDSNVAALLYLRVVFNTGEAVTVSYSHYLFMPSHKGKGGACKADCGCAGKLPRTMKLSRRALGLNSLGLPWKRLRRGCAQSHACSASQASMCCQARSLTVLWIATTLDMSCSLGSQPCRLHPAHTTGGQKQTPQGLKDT